MDKIETFTKILIPDSVLGDCSLTALERLILIKILSLCSKEGYCWATNDYFRERFNVSKQTILKSISNLSKEGYIVLEYDKTEKNNSKRKIEISQVFRNKILGIKRNYNTSIQKNFKQYNNKNYNNKRNNIGPIISKDVDGTPLWNKKRCEAQIASIEEQNEMKRIIKSFERKGESEINE